MEEKVRECSNIHDISFLYFILVAVPLVLAEAAGNRNKSCTYLINSLTICYNVFFYLIRILSWYKLIASST